MEGKALVLDFGGVISRTMFETHDLTEQALGLAPGTLTWRGPFAPGTDPLWRSMQDQEITERDYWLTRTIETGRLVGKNWKKMEDFIQAARGADPDAIIRPEAISAIERAKAAGKKLAVLSNELDLFYGADFRTRLPFLSLFDVVVDATHTRILKPDPRAYNEVCTALSLAPQHCIFVDDQMKNIRGAIDFGMQTVHFDVRNPGESYTKALALLNVPTSGEAT